MTQSMVVIKRLWHSPTFTAWLGKAGASARILVVLPLMLTHFDEEQLLAWLLFGTVLFFSGLMAAQTSLVHSRMIAIAYGGAASLEVIKGNEGLGASGSPNWYLINRLYGSMALIDLLHALAGVVIASVVGWLSISPSIVGYGGADEVWGALVVFVLVQFLVQLLRRYAVTLRGINKVALVNRWEASLSVASALLGGCVILLGGSLVALAIVMQGTLLLGVIVYRSVLIGAVGVELSGSKMCRLDNEVIRWVWGPSWRSCVRSLANTGGARVGVVVFARYSDPVSLASMLLSLRLLQAVSEVSSAPLVSHVPRLGAALARGDKESFCSGLIRALKWAFWIQAIGVIAIWYLAFPVLYLVGSDTTVCQEHVLVALGLSHLLATQVQQSLTITVISNNIIAVRRMMVSACVSAGIAVLWIPYDSHAGFIVASYWPVIVILNIEPVRQGSKLMGVSTRYIFGKIAMSPLLCVFIAAGVLFVLPWRELSLRIVGVFL